VGFKNIVVKLNQYRWDNDADVIQSRNFANFDHLNTQTLICNLVKFFSSDK